MTEMQETERTEIERLLNELEKALRIEPAEVPLEPRLRNALSKARLIVEDVRVVEHVLDRLERRKRYIPAGNFDFRVRQWLDHLEHEAGSRAAAFDELRERVLEHLLGQRVIINMALNGDWTHAHARQSVDREESS